MRRTVLPLLVAIALAGTAYSAVPAEPPTVGGARTAAREVPPFDAGGAYGSPYAPDRGLPGEVDADRYRVGPGDVFELNLRGAVSRAIPLTVGPEGTVFVPGFGSLRLGARTLDEARAAMKELLEPGLHGVRWDLRLVRVRTIRVHRTGDVHAPGPIDVPATSRVSDVLPSGDMLETASRRRVRITWRDGSIALADIDLFLRSGRNDLNPYLQGGEVIHVPVAVDFVEIHGAVAHPGRYELGPRDSLRTLFELAGGPLPATLREGAMLVRWQGIDQADSTFFDLEHLYRGEFNPRLSEGDRVYVYFTPAYHELHQATILGEIMRPGVYPIVLGRTRLSDLVRSAGGFRARADLSALHLVRPARASQEADGELERLSQLSRSEMTSAEYEVLRTRLTARRNEFRVDWRRLASEPHLDVLLAEGDVVRVDPILASIRVAGEVRRPGLVDHGAVLRVNDYVRMAGGFTRRADRGKVMVTRSASGQTLPARDVQAIEPGDMIWIPERPDRTIWDHLQSVITVSAQVATVVIAVRAAR